MRIAASLCLVVVVGALGCAETEVKSRDIVRKGPLRGVPLLALARADVPAQIDAGTNVLTDEELVRVEAAVNAAFAARLQAAGKPTTGRVLKGRLLHCILDAGPGQRHTVYKARCRGSLEANTQSGKAVETVVVEAVAMRRERTQAITQSDLEAMKKDPRNPVLDEGSAQDAVIAAVEAVADRLLLRGKRDAEQSATLAQSEQIAATARVKAARNPDNASVRMAVAADLARHGTEDDSDILLRWRDDVRPGVRLALAVALSELCAKNAHPLLHQMRIDIDPRVRDAASRGLACIEALHGVAGAPAAQNETPRKQGGA